MSRYQNSSPKGIINGSSRRLNWHTTVCKTDARQRPKLLDRRKPVSVITLIGEQQGGCVNEATATRRVIRAAERGGLQQVAHERLNVLRRKGGGASPQ